MKTFSHGQEHAPLDYEVVDLPVLAAHERDQVPAGRELPPYVDGFGRKLELLKRLPAFADTDRGGMA